MLRCKVWRANLFTVVNLFTTLNFIALKKLIKIEFERREQEKSQTEKRSQLLSYSPWKIWFHYDIF